MTYYDKINDTLTNFLQIKDLSKIVSSYLFTCNKYIVIQDRQKIYNEFPKEFYETSFGNEFILCDSIQDNKKRFKDGDFFGNNIVCSTSIVYDTIYNNNFKSLKLLNNSHNNISGDYDVNLFLNEWNSVEEDWCIFLEIFCEMYWAININKKSNLYGHIIFIKSDDRSDFGATYVCENISEFENMFYNIVEEVHITEKYSDARKKKYGKDDLCGEYFDYDGRDYAFEKIKEQQIYILQKKYGYDYRDKKNIEKVNMEKKFLF